MSYNLSEATRLLTGFVPRQLEPFLVRDLLAAVLRSSYLSVPGRFEIRPMPDSLDEWIVFHNGKYEAEIRFEGGRLFVAPTYEADYNLWQVCDKSTWREVKLMQDPEHQGRLVSQTVLRFGAGYTTIYRDATAELIEALISVLKRREVAAP